MQICSSECTVHDRTKDPPTVTFDSLVSLAVENPTEKPRNTFKHIDCTVDCTSDGLWNEAHGWLPGSDHDCKRTHAFFRAIREETNCARLQQKGKKNCMTLE